jgi:membrane-associated phospholipid phosphatase
VADRSGPPPEDERSLGLLEEATRVDQAVYAAVADTPTPRLDQIMRRVSSAADYSRLSMSCAAVLALLGGRRGRRAAGWGLCSVGVTSAVVNLVLKPVGRRERPDRVGQDVPTLRQVEMPESRSMPSGHTAAAVAFAEGASRAAPALGLPLHGLAALVGYSRVHTGVHYPGDVVAGAVLGAVLGEFTTSCLARRRMRRQQHRRWGRSGSVRADRSADSAPASS